MTRPDVTIGIPTYNRGETYLPSALKAALEQTHENIEILVSDNASTDNTADIVRGFPDPRVKYFVQSTNIGARANMNFLLARAQGRYFHVFMDDDQIDADFIEVCLESLVSRSAPGLVTTGSRVVDEDGDILRDRENLHGNWPVEDLILAWYQRRIHLFLCSTLFNTAVLRRVGGFEPKYNHFDDVAAEFKCAAASGCQLVREVKAGLRSHQASMTRSADVGEWCDSSLALLTLALSLSGGRRDELVRLGPRVSATRNYILANELPSIRRRWVANFTVLQRFGFRVWPDREAVRALVGSTAVALRSLSANRE